MVFSAKTEQTEGPPFVYKNSLLLCAAYTTTPDAIEEHLPAPLRPAPGNTVLVSVGCMDSVQLGRYFEAIVAIPALHGRSPGNFVTHAYLDSGEALCCGRSIYGFPKKLARLSITQNGPEWRATVYRSETTLIDLQITPDNAPPKGGFGAAPLWYNLKEVPSVEGPRPSLKQLTEVEVTEQTVSLLGEGKAKLGLCGAPSDALERLPISRMLGGSVLLVNNSLGYGRVIHDYLAEIARVA